MGVSPRYTPVTGRLHTRYAHVRRSPPGYCYPALPLDLHVLSLPLAFILSQDQTLHCKNCFFLPLTRSCLTRRPRRLGVRHTLSLDPRISMCLRFLRDAFRPSKAGAKIRPFFKLQKIFFEKIGRMLGNMLPHRLLMYEKKFMTWGKTPENGPKNYEKLLLFSKNGP